MQIKELWRYPFKSMGGEKLETATFEQAGMPGDRAFALRENNTTRGAKKFPGLMALKARYEGDPVTSSPIVTFTDGTSLDAGTPEFAREVSERFGENIDVERTAPATDLDYYRRREQMSEAETRAMFALEDGEPLPPDLAKLGQRAFEFQSPPGTFFDCFPVMIMTTASLEALQAAAADSKIDVRRFRPNVLIDTDDIGLVEQEWIGKRVTLGGVTLAVEAPCPRCVMTTIGFDDLPKDPKIMRALVQACEQNLGVYAEVVTPGKVSVGDAVTVEGA